MLVMTTKIRVRTINCWVFLLTAVAVFSASALSLTNKAASGGKASDGFLLLDPWIAATLTSSKISCGDLFGSALNIVSLTPLNRRSENVLVEAIIVPELELRNVKVQISFVDVMESAHDTAFEDAPEALNRVRANRADNVLALGMVDSDVLREMLIDAKPKRRPHSEFGTIPTSIICAAPPENTSASHLCPLVRLGRVARNEICR
jgi:hypothetical protein